jgi:hypothetical protein
VVIIAFSVRSERLSPPRALVGAAVNCPAAPSPFQHPQGPYVAAHASSGRPKASCKRRAWLRRRRRRTAASAREARLLPLVAARRRAARGASRWPPRADAGRSPAPCGVALSARWPPTFARARGPLPRALSHHLSTRRPPRAVDPVAYPWGLGGSPPGAIWTCSRPLEEGALRAPRIGLGWPLASHYQGCTRVLSTATPV